MNTRLLPVRRAQGKWDLAQPDPDRAYEKVIQHELTELLFLDAERSLAEYEAIRQNLARLTEEAALVQQRIRLLQALTDLEKSLDAAA